MHKPWEVLPDIDSLQHQLVPHFTSSTPHGPLVPLEEHKMGETLLPLVQDPAHPVDAPAPDNRVQLGSFETVSGSERTSGCASGLSQQHKSLNALGNQSAGASLQPGSSLLRGQEAGRAQATLIPPKRGPGRPRKQQQQAAEPPHFQSPFFVRKAPGQDNRADSGVSAGLPPPCANHSALLVSQEDGGSFANDRAPGCVVANQRTHPSEAAADSSVPKQWEDIAKAGTVGPNSQLQKGMLEKGVKKPWRFNICKSAPFMDLLLPRHGPASAQTPFHNSKDYKQVPAIASNGCGNNKVVQCAADAELRAGPGVADIGRPCPSNESEAEQEAAAFIAALGSVSCELSSGLPGSRESANACAPDNGLHPSCTDVSRSVTLPGIKPTKERFPSPQESLSHGTDIAMLSPRHRAPLPLITRLEEGQDDEKVDVVATVCMRPKCPPGDALGEKKLEDLSSQSACASVSSRPGHMQKECSAQPVPQREGIASVYCDPQLVQSKATWSRILEHHGSAGLLGPGGLCADQLGDGVHAPNGGPPVRSTSLTVEQAGQGGPLSALAELRRLAESTPVIYGCSPVPATIVGAQDTTNASFCQFLNSMAKTPSPEPVVRQEVKCRGNSMSPANTFPGAVLDLLRQDSSGHRTSGSFQVPLGAGQSNQEPAHFLGPFFGREAPREDKTISCTDSAGLPPPCANHSAPLISQEDGGSFANDRAPGCVVANQRTHPSEAAADSSVPKQWESLDAEDDQGTTSNATWHEAIASLFGTDDNVEKGSKDCSEGEDFQDEPHCITLVTPAEAAALPSKELVQSVYHLPILKAAATLKVGLGTLKRSCRLHNIGRWPYRKFNSLDKLIRSVEDCSEQDPRGAEHVIRGLTMLKEEVYKNPRFEFDNQVKKLRQANFKMQYKKRTQGKGE